MEGGERWQAEQEEARQFDVLRREAQLTRGRQDARKEVERAQKRLVQPFNGAVCVASVLHGPAKPDPGLLEQANKMATFLEQLEFLLSDEGVCEAGKL